MCLHPVAVVGTCYGGYVDADLAFVKGNVTKGVSTSMVYAPDLTHVPTITPVYFTHVHR